MADVRQGAHYPDVDWRVLAVAKTFASQTRTGPHSHDRAQLLFAVEGVMVATTALGSWLVPRGHALWMPPRMVHDVAMHGEVSMRTAYVAPESAAGLGADVRVLVVGRLLEAALAELSLEVANEQRPERLHHLGWLVLDEAARAPIAPMALPLPQDARLLRVARGLIADPGCALAIDPWCDLAGLSRRTFTRRFRSETGLSFAAWRRRLRLLTAAARLADGEPLARAAAGLDYRNLAAFRAMARRDQGHELLR